MRKIRLGFLNTHPIQYFAPLYAYLNQSGDLAVSAIYLSDYSLRGAEDHAFGRVVKWDVDLLSGYEAHFVRGASTRDEARGFFSALVPEVWGEVRRSGLDALVVHGHSPAAQLVGIAAAKARGIPVFMRGETHLGLARTSLKLRLRKLAMGTLYARLDGMLAIGSANAAFYRAMGVPDRRIFLTPYTVDNARFIEAARLTHGERADMRRQLGVSDDRPIILYSAKFDERKCPQDMLRAAARLNAEGAIFQMAMIGSGALENELRALVGSLGMQNVHFHGFANQSAMPHLYGACDIFALPSRDEPWGLAINEAMCAELPIVASAEIGCVPDLVKEGVNGYTFNAGDVGGLAAALRRLIGDAAARRKMGTASRDLISRWSYAEVHQGLRNALSSVGLSAPQESLAA
jgi:glycosyltransferase involved in cell wall biosynthesis